MERPVVEAAPGATVAVPTAAGAEPAGVGPERTAGSYCPALLVALLRTAAEQLHGALHVYHDFSGVTLDAVFFPLAGLQFAFDVDLRTFAQILTGDLCNLAEHRHTVPFGFLDFLAGLLVGPLFAGRQTQVGHGVTVRQVANFGILAARTDQYDFVNPTGHNVLLGWARCRHWVDQLLERRAIQ